MKTKLKSYGYYIGIAMVGVVIGTLLQFAKAWTEPTIAPPNASVGAPINTSAIGQSKFGNLSVLGLASSTIISSPQICLNGSCQTSWPGGDNLGSHKATQALDMNGNAISNVSSITINVGGTNLSLKAINGSEDTYGTISRGGGSCTDTCDGNKGADFQCGVNDSKTCADCNIYDETPGEFGYNPIAHTRTVVCKKALVFTE